MLESAGKIPGPAPSNHRAYRALACKVERRNIEGLSPTITEIVADYVRSSITIRRSAANLGSEVVYKTSKSKKSQRQDVMPPFVVDLLKAHRREQKKRRGDLGLGRPDDDGFVFTGADGTPWGPNELSRQSSRLTRRRKLRAIHFHYLRRGMPRSRMRPVCR